MKQRILLLVLACLACNSAWAYDFSAIAPTGQTLYYNIIDSNNVEVTNESGYIGGGYTTYPTGDLVIPDSVVYSGTVYFVTAIGDDAFWNCKDLTSVIMPDRVTAIGTWAFADCKNMSYIHISAGVTTIGENVFSSCSALISVTIPDSVTSIGYSAFEGCSGLTSVTIPNAVTSIGSSAFYGCSGLTSVTIPNAVTSIGSSAFLNCKGLTEIIALPKCATMVSPNSFNGVSSIIPIYIPCGSLMAYSNFWSYFSNFVEEEGFVFSAQSADTTMGDVQVLTEPMCELPHAVIYAKAHSGFGFDHWSDGNNENPRSLTLTSDSSLTAYFSTMVYDTVFVHDTVIIHDTIYITDEAIGDVTSPMTKVYCSQGQIMVEGAEGCEVTLYDAVGRRMAARREVVAPLRFDVPASGAYLVKVGHAPASRVVVIR